VPDNLVGAVIKVLQEWSAEGWSGAGRPVGVVTLASRAQPRLVGSLAARVAEIGRLPLLGTLDRVADTAPAGGSNSAWRLRAVHEAFALDAQTAARIVAAGPILLVDDLVDSGWTCTITARLLRQTGASAVLPLVLALTG
jgi:ATP-dependent DNA helicase RecQ